MPKIKITNPRNVIEAPIKKNYFKIRATSGPKGDKGDTGATGPQGPQGPQGNAATIYVGSTTTLPVGQDATVENVGSQYAAVLNFGIPQGPQGPQGAKGDKGDKGDKGEQGNTGNTGPAGQNATVYIGTTTTGTPGSQASVYNSGTENNAVLNFTIPQGAKGDTGATGPQGPAGQDGQDGKDFAPSVVDSLPAVGEESKLYLTPKAHTPQTATGNPITATITDGAGQIESFQLDGDTFQQSYEGKNLLPVARRQSQTKSGITLTINDDGSFDISGTSTANTNFDFIMPLSQSGIVGGASYTISSNRPVGDVRYYVHSCEQGGAWRKTIIAFIKDGTLTAAEPTTDYINFVINVQQGVSVSLSGVKTMIELGSTATSFEPFVGGIASPNPSYPQPIQVVTGEQTVSINGTNYPISLGSIELCKLGTYQDYIYKDGSDWKIRKATGKVALSSIRWYDYAYRLKRSDINPIADMLYVANNQQVGAGLTNGFKIRQGAGLSSEEWLGYFAIDTNRIAFNVGLGGDNPSGNLYYALATPTDTEITDSTLISQLNAIASASLENGTNTLTNSATGSNLAGDMEVGYFGYDPTNRYDKWLWLDINNAYEKLGS